MFGFLPEPDHMPCAECGASVARSDRDEHVCEAERVLEYRMFKLREEIDCFETKLGEYLASPQGRFAVWDAARRR